MSQDKINATFLNMFTGDDQETEVIEDWEIANEGGKLKKWREEWQPELSEEEVTEIEGLIRKMSEEECVDEGVLELVKPYVKGFKKWLLKDGVFDEEYVDNEDWGLEESQM